MGGFGSGKNWRGRKKRGGKLLIEYLPKLDASEIMKLHNKGSSIFSLGLIEFFIIKNKIYFNQKTAYKSHFETIQISLLPCYFGGIRYFFLCPICNKQMKLLYWNSTFACRQCLNLSYRSQNITLSHRLLLLREKIGKKIQHNELIKPKWMRQKTFKCLKKVYSQIDEKEQIADIFSLKSKQKVDEIFGKYGSAIIASEMLLLF